MNQESSYAEETDFILSSIKEMRSVLCELGHSPLAGFNLIERPDTIDFIYSMFYDMLTDNLQTLANEINTLSTWTDEINAWEFVIKDKSEYEQFFLHKAVIGALTTAATNLPYALKQRFVFCACRTTHQANRFIGGNWSERDLPADDRINAHTPDKISGHWTMWAPLKAAIFDVNSSDYIQATEDFRSKFNHRIPLSFGYGHTNFVTRTPISESGRVGASYAFCGQGPLQLKATTDALRSQVDASILALDQYVCLLREQVNAIHCIRPSA